MVATGQEPTLPPDVQQDAHASLAVDDPSEYVEAITQRLQLTHQKIASPSPPSIANPYQEGSLIFAMTTPPERTSKLASCWKGPFRICRVPNDYQVVYEDSEVQRTIHINHAIPAKFTAPDLPKPMPAPETPRPPLGYVPTGLLGHRPPPPAPAAPAWDSSSSSTTASTTPPPAAPAESEMQPPATAPANQRPEPAPCPRRSPRLNLEPGRMCAIKGPPINPPHQSNKTSRIARTYPLTVPYNQCLGSRADSLSFPSLRLVDLRNGQSQYLSTVKQLVDALPKTVDPSSRYALRSHIARPGQKRLWHSMRAVIWWLLPSHGIFRRTSDSLQYFLTRQGRRVVLPPSERYLTWVHDPAPPPTRYHGDLTSPAPPGNRDNQENTPPQDASCQLPRRLWPRRRREKQPGSSTNENSASRSADPATWPGSVANRNSAFQEAHAATQPRSTANRNSPFTENRPGTSGSSRSTPVEHPRTFLRPQHPRFWTNQNSERRFDPDHPEFRGVYKPAQPSIQQNSAHRLHRDSFSGSGLSSPALQRSHRDSFSGSPPGQLNIETSLTDPHREARIAGGSRLGIVYPLPRATRPDTRLEVDAAPPEAAALSRAERSPTVLDIQETGWLESPRCPESFQRCRSRSPRRHTRKWPRNRSSGVYRPKKRSPHRVH